jgi:membrane dipeptidase
VIRGLADRDGVIGVLPYNVFLKAGWKRGDSRQEVTLLHLIAHIDHICQITGNARHVALGSDFDGSFGVQSAPAEIDTIADLQKLNPLLAERGYSQDEIANILGKNWLNWLKNILPVN